MKIHIPKMNDGNNFESNDITNNNSGSNNICDNLINYNFELP